MARRALPQDLAADIAASFQAAVTDILADRLEHALLLRPDASAVIIAGGVAANTAIRTRLAGLVAAHSQLNSHRPAAAPTARTTPSWSPGPPSSVSMPASPTHFPPRAGPAGRWNLYELPPRLPRRQFRRLHQARAIPARIAPRHAAQGKAIPACSTPMPASAATTSPPARRRKPANGARASPACSPPIHQHWRTTSPWSTASASIPARPPSPPPCCGTKDRLIACELHPEDAATLKREFSGTPGVAIHERDGYEAMRAFLPPPEKRALILIDPPFERPDEFSTLAKSLIAAYEKFKSGVYVVWYPIKHRAPCVILPRP